MKFSYKVIRDRKVVDKYHTRFKRRFLKNLRMINWQDGPLKVLLKVSYGRRIDNFGKLTTFDNEGIYDNERDLWMAFNAFIEED